MVAVPRVGGDTNRVVFLRVVFAILLRNLDDEVE